MALLLAGCAAGNVKFEQPAEQDLVLGVTSKQAVIARFGDKGSAATSTTNGIVLDILEYAYVRSTEGPAVLGDKPVRALALAFHDGKLVSKSFSSSFQADSTQFDVAKAQMIRPGMPASAVRDLLGPAGGEKVYPATEAPGDTAWIYWFGWMDRLKIHQTTLVVEFKPDGSVLRAVCRESTQ